MKSIDRLTLPFLLAVLTFTACRKDEIIDMQIDIPVVTPANKPINGLFLRSATQSDGLELGCITIAYPFELLLADSLTTFEITSEAAFLTALGDSTAGPIDFVYPLQLTTEDGETTTVYSVEALAEAFANCIPENGWGEESWFFPAWTINYENSCYQLVYPVNLLDLDSTTVTATDEAGLVALLADGNLYSFAFPLDLTDEDGNPVTAIDAEDLFDLLAACGPGYGGGCGIGTFACYQLVYPAPMLMMDGTTTLVNNNDEFTALMLSGEWAGFGFPLTLLDADGNEITVTDEAELNEALLACDPSGGGGNTGGNTMEILFGCYSVVYPVTLQLVDSTTTVVQDEAGLLATFLDGTWAGFGFPLTLLDEDGQEITIQNEQELAAAWEACDSTGGGGPGFEDADYFCYDFSYPFSVTDLFTGNTITFQDAAEWLAFHQDPIAAPNAYDFIFPLTLLDQDGQELTVEDHDGLFEAIQDCW